MPDNTDKQECYVVDHPIVQDRLTKMRNRNTTPQMFRLLLEEITMLLAYPATQSIRTKIEDVETPICTTQGKIISEEITIAPILRAGLGMISPMIKLLPDAKISHIGLYRDPQSKQPKLYYKKLPSQSDIVFILDPMIATGRSACTALSLFSSARTVVISLIASQEGISAILEKHNTEIYTAAVDLHLDDMAYITPGLGDAGDRLFGC